MRDFFAPGCSPAVGLAGAVAASHSLASATAIKVLGEGGNAVDAAVAATFVMAVVEPQSTGIGGDCFALVHPAGAARPVGLNGSGRTPMALDVEAAREAGGAPLAETSVHSVTVPGFVDGLTRLLDRYGTLPLPRVMAPAIAYAEVGFAVMQRTADEWAAVKEKLARTPEAKAALLSDGKPPAAGDVVRFPALAATLRRIAAEGADAFYRSDLTEHLVRFLSGYGGYHRLDDFARHAGREVAPISAPCRGHDVWQIPPNGQGATALMMLRLLDRSDAGADPFESAARHRRLAAAARAAYGLRDALIADPDFGDVPLAPFLEPDGAISPEPERAAAARGDTAYVAVVDRERNAVSLISSLFEGFGCGLYEPQTGVVFHNRGSGFSAARDHPNALAPGKRPLHTIIPGMVTRDGRPVVCLGVTGGPYQPTGQVQVLSGLFDHGLDIQAAIDSPRSFLSAGTLQLEPRLAGIGAALTEAGFAVAEAASPIGGAHGIVVDWERGTLTAGSDARKDGRALAH